MPKQQLPNKGDEFKPGDIAFCGKRKCEVLAWSYPYQKYLARFATGGSQFYSNQLVKKNLSATLR